MAKDLNQIYWIDYTEMFAYVAKLNTIRILLSLAANSNWLLYQLDVKNAFLNEKLEDKVYMHQPLRFEKSLGSQIVCKLKMSLYDLKQFLWAWFDRFSTLFRNLGYS